MPGDAWEAAREAAQAPVSVAHEPGPAYLRLGRLATPTLCDERGEFVLDGARVLREPGRVLFIATGP
ncbi:hypothetical protein [Streptomyces sp. CT34]|uniref:hypothetical protein n=1 Tax=Streptomyces sp. CT34 TaxID=1553907 RepID=UPI001F5294D3|nr:hypothetical protein [Streptomyces sp. CT34]